MKYLLIFQLLLMTGCSQLVSQISPAPDPAQTKLRVMEIVQAQRSDKDWMKIDSCPVDTMPEKSGQSKLVAKDCAKNPAKCLERCDAGDGDSCYALALLIQEHDSIDNDVAHILFKNSCRFGITSGCTNAAAILFEKEDEPLIACASRTFEAACSKNDPWACTMNGLSLGDGIGRAKNISGAIKSFDRACEISVEKNGEACTKAKELKALYLKN